MSLHLMLHTRNHLLPPRYKVQQATSSPLLLPIEAAPPTLQPVTPVLDPLPNLPQQMTVGQEEQMHEDINPPLD